MGLRYKGEAESLHELDPVIPRSVPIPNSLLNSLAYEPLKRMTFQSLLRIAPWTPPSMPKTRKTLTMLLQMVRVTSTKLTPNT